MKKKQKKPGKETGAVVSVRLWCLLGLIALFIVASPVIFTQPSLFGLKWLDFSDKGGIGDTIGGITAPFIGLLSAGLLIWTLYEQIKINREQKKYNDTSRILSILTHIHVIDDSVIFLYSTPYALCEGHGLSSLSILSASGQNDVSIAFEELEIIESRVATIFLEVKSLSSIVNESSMEMEDKTSFNRIIDNYLTSLEAFYNSIASNKVRCLFPNPDDSDYSQRETRFAEKAKQLLSDIQELQEIIKSNSDAA